MILVCRTDVKDVKKKSSTTIQASTKILIRNIPFQATIKEITELFKYVFHFIVFLLLHFIYSETGRIFMFSLLKYQSVRRVESSAATEKVSWRRKTQGIRVRGVLHKKRGQGAH